MDRLCGRLSRSSRRTTRLATGGTLGSRCFTRPAGLSPTAARLRCRRLPGRGFLSRRLPRSALTSRFLVRLRRGRRTLRPPGNPTPHTRHHHPHQGNNRYRTLKLPPDARQGLIVFPAHISTLTVFRNLNSIIPQRTIADTFETPLNRPTSNFRPSISTRTHRRDPIKWQNFSLYVQTCSFNNHNIAENKGNTEISTSAQGLVPGLQLT